LPIKIPLEPEEPPGELSLPLKEKKKPKDPKTYNSSKITNKLSKMNYLNTVTTS
jgi:hypothetical protein